MEKAYWNVESGNADMLSLSVEVKSVYLWSFYFEVDNRFEYESEFLGASIRHVFIFNSLRPCGYYMYNKF